MKVKLLSIVLIIGITLTIFASCTSTNTTTEFETTMPSSKATNEILTEENSLISESSKNDVPIQPFTKEILPPPLSPVYDWSNFYPNLNKVLRDNTEYYYSFYYNYFAYYLNNEKYQKKTGSNEYFNYIIYENNLVGITEYKGKQTNVIIPKKIEGYNVAYICDECFAKNIFIKSVQLPSTVVFIGQEAFLQNILLEKVDLGDSLIYLSNGSFSECYSLETISLPKTLIAIGPYSFLSCKNLKAINGGKGLKFISGKTFAVVPKLKKIQLPKDVILEYEDSIASNIEIEYF